MMLAQGAADEPRWQGAFGAGLALTKSNRTKSRFLDFAGLPKRRAILLRSKWQVRVGLQIRVDQRCPGSLSLVDVAAGGHAGVEFDFAESVFVPGDILLQKSEQSFCLLRA